MRYTSKNVKIRLNTYCTLFDLFDERRNYLFIEREYIVCDGQSNTQNAGGWGDRGLGGGGVIILAKLCTTK